MPLGFFLFIMAMPGLFMVIGLITTLKDYKKTREVNDHPVVPITLAEEGFTTLEGICTPLLTGPLYASLTGRACCWYTYKVQKYLKHSSEESWETIEQNTSFDPLLLLDKSGHCAVWHERAEITTPHRNLWYGSTPDPLDRDPSDSGYEEPRKKEYRYIEDRIHEGDPIYVMGDFTRENILAESDDVDPDNSEPDEVDYSAALPPNTGHMVNTVSISHGTSVDLLNTNSHKTMSSLIVTLMGLGGVLLLLLLRFAVFNI